MSTVHANSPKDAFSRLQAMVLMADLDLPTRVVTNQLASAIKVVVQVSRLSDGSRKIISVAEVTGVEDDAVRIQEIFTFERTGVDDAGKVMGRFRTVWREPRLLARIKQYGIALPEGLFDETVDVNQ